MYDFDGKLLREEPYPIRPAEGAFGEDIHLALVGSDEENVYYSMVVDKEYHPESKGTALIVLPFDASKEMSVIWTGE